MCLNPSYIPHPALKSAKANLLIAFRADAESSSHFLKSSDLERLSPMMYVPCRHCSECLSTRASEWRFRLGRELTKHSGKKNLFLTLTINDSCYGDFMTPQVYLKSFFEALKSKYRVRFRHFFVDELGGETGRLHFHGILFGFPRHFNGKREYTLGQYNSLIASFWKFGFTWTGYVDHRTCNYVTKYILKPQVSEDWYKQQLYVSPALGRDDSYISQISHNLFHSGSFLISTSKGTRLCPQYWRNRIRKNISLGMYYRCMDRSFAALGKTWKVLGKTYKEYTAYLSALRVARDLDEKRKRLESRFHYLSDSLKNLYGSSSTISELQPRYIEF